jgi:DNA mismatch endonuclease (patch repair protein)
MTDPLTPLERSERMSRVRSKDSKPELVLRRLVHGMGFRYRLHRRDLPGTPDLVFPSRRKVMFMHSCFWHQHPDPQCKLARRPKSRAEFWIPKLEGNRLRDIDNERRLKELGWDVMIVWECQLTDTNLLRQRVKEFLDQ